MKQALVNLLFEEYKQARLFDELEEKGIDFTDVAVNNLDSVCDIIGFPKSDNFRYIYNETTKMIEESYDKDGVSREYIYQKFDNIFDSIEKIQKIQVTDKGLKMTEHEDEVLALKKISEFVDWLYVEQKKLS